MAFKNRVRLPIRLHKPQFVEERDEYRLANGITKTLSVVIRKVYEGQTDELPEKLHERLKIALAHDSVSIEGDKYIGLITQEGSYDIEWIDFLSRPIAQAKFKANVTPFNASNSNCGTCAEYAQVVAEDDSIGTLNEGDTVDVDILANDSICCNPVAISLVTFNSDFVASIVINPDNTITLILKTPLPNTNSVILATYRAECDNGMYDEANIIANINGTDPTPVCLAPTDPVWDGSPDDTTADFSWLAPSPAPTCGYHWEVRTSLGAVIASGDAATESVSVTGLPSNTSNLRFFVRSNCCSLDSNYAGPVIFSLPPPSGGGSDDCGQYELENGGFVFANVSYTDCTGNNQNVLVPGGTAVTICALQYSPGNPVEIISEDDNVDINYLGLC